MFEDPFGAESTTVTAVITAAQKAYLVELGAGNISAGLRYRLSTPSATPSGAVWIDHPDALSDPEDATGPSVLACPGGVVMHGVCATSLIIDAEGSEILLLNGDDDDAVVRPLDLALLANLAAGLTPAILAVVNPGGPDVALLPAGLQARRLAPGVISIGGKSLTVAVDIRHALQFAAEVAGLLVRSLTDRPVAITGLERALQAEPAGVAP
jgi:hypothetical protein